MIWGLTDALPAYGLWSLAGTIALLLLFAAARGRVRIEAGWGGWTIPRFNGFERLVHWLLALSFIVLAVTGFGTMYGAPVLRSLIGDEAADTLRGASRMLHARAGFPFMAALALTSLIWLRHSLPHWRDVVWLAKGGGLLVRGWRAAAWKFNAGQKLFYWAVVLGGVVLSLTGLALLFPWMAPLSRTLTLLGASLAPVDEARYASSWHTAAALALTCLVVVHIYLRTYGIQGAASAMGTGEVDVNWARQHHGLWAEREIKRIEDAATEQAPDPRMAPAE